MLRQGRQGLTRPVIVVLEEVAQGKVEARFGPQRVIRRNLGEPGGGDGVVLFFVVKLRQAEGCWSVARVEADRLQEVAALLLAAHRHQATYVALKGADIEARKTLAEVLAAQANLGLELAKNLPGQLLLHIDQASERARVTHPGGEGGGPNVETTRPGTTGVAKACPAAARPPVSSSSKLSPTQSRSATFAVFSNGTTRTVSAANGEAPTRRASRPRESQRRSEEDPGIPNFIIAEASGGG